MDNKNISKKRIWSNKIISFVAVLIAVSIIFLIIGVSIFPPAILPTFRFSFIGLPIKITGLIFGPIIGIAVAILSDFLSQFYVPSLYSWVYTFALILNALIPGLVMLIFKFFIDNKYEKKLIQKNIDKIKINKQILNLYLYLGIFFLLLVIIFLGGFLSFFSEEFFKNNNYIKNKYVFIAIMLISPVLIILFLILARFKISPKNFKILVPIIVFSAILEPLAVSLLSYGDVLTEIAPNFETALITHILTTPVKLWVNSTVIYVTYKIVSPLIFKKQVNSY